MTYWSRMPITTHSRRQENNQRAFLLPREPEQWDSHAVETTGYALLVLLTKEGVTANTEQIMRWLNAVRDWDCAFISTVVSVCLTIPKLRQMVFFYFLQLKTTYSNSH